MGQDRAELAKEQAYFDSAREQRERKNGGSDEAASAAANPRAAKWLRTWLKGRRDSARDPNEAVAFGRIDPESDAPLYIGHALITDDRHEVLVVNWQAAAAAPYYKASTDDPCGLVRKRTFTTEGNQIVDFTELVFKQLADDIAKLESLDGPDAALLSELDSARASTMRGIVTTIQAAQYELIRAPLDQVLVIEGGPGTGKTAVALHRVSWLLFNYHDRLSAAEVLVVGPHPAFTRYIRTVLPDLGDVDVVQTDIGQLAPDVHRGRSEAPETNRLKGEARMAGLLARALEARIGVPEAAERMRFDGRFVTLSGAEIAAAMTVARETGGPYHQRRQIFRARLVDLVRERGGPSDAGARLDPVDNLLDRVWPQFSAPAFLRALLGSKQRLAAAAGDSFTADELALLHRRGADRLSEQLWSAADLPLLDEVDHLLSAGVRRYAHILVDEAQDLSPMQVRSIARRSATGSLTVVGDLAQSTGAWARDTWTDVLDHLPTTHGQSIVRLRYGYRVPRQVYEMAARLLPIIAPWAEPLYVVRPGPAEPSVHRVPTEERAGRAVSVARAHAADGRFVGLVCPPAHRAELEAALAANHALWSSADRGELDTAINLVAPHEAKGLEFDAVVVIEPAEIVSEYGHRMLFVALTRTTRYLDIVCVGEHLPLDISMPLPALAEPEVVPEPIDVAQLDQVARDVAALVASGVPADLWHEALQRAAEMLDERSAPPPSGRHQRA